MRECLGGWPSAGHSQYPEEVERNPGSRDVNAEDFHLHFFPRAQAEAPSPLCFGQLRFCYEPDGDQPRLSHSYIHEDPKQSGVLHFARENCPNLQIFQTNYASLEVRLIKICEERG